MHGLDEEVFVQTSMFDEDDMRLLHGLQIAPRIPWAEAARILGSTPATLMNRWERLRGQGLAWIVSHPSGLAGDVLTAFVEVDCEPGRHREAIYALAQDPRAMTIEQMAHGRDLMLTVMTPDLAALSRYLLDDLPAVPGVRHQRAFLALDIHRQGRDWQLQTLDRAERQGFEAAVRHAEPPTGRLPRDPWPILTELGRNGRASAAEIARRTGRNPATVRRQVATVISSGVLSFRCEVAQDPALWGLHCTWLARVPEVEKERTVAALGTLPELRLLVTISGEFNLFVSVWTRSPAELLRVERTVGERLPWLEIGESIVVLRTVKRMGWLIDEGGRGTGEVVVPAVLGSEAGPPSS